MNKLLQIAPHNSIGHSEQVYLHLRKGEEDLAFKEIDTYIAEHPQDEGFKRGVAYDIDSYSNSCYYYDQAQNATFIADKESYEKCLKLRTKATEVFSDEHTQKMLEDAKFYGQKEWDSWNIDAIRTLSVYALIFLLLVPVIGFILLAVDIALVYFSFRPYWQINKTYITGERGALENAITMIGDVAAKFGIQLLRFMWITALEMIRFCIKIATGGLFR